MLPELLELILQNVHINTVKSFALSNHYFYKLISKKNWWVKRIMYDDLEIISEISDIENCHLLSHQHYPASIKHYTIPQWINNYNESCIAKMNAIHTSLVYQIELTINPLAVIKISFIRRPLLPYQIEKNFCQAMLTCQVEELKNISLTLYNTCYKIKCSCLPTSFEIIFTYTNLNSRIANTIELLTIFYADPSAIITNDHGKPYRDTEIWKTAEYLGHIKI